MRLINKISKSIAFRSILIVVTLLIVYSAVSGILGYRVTSQSLYDQYMEDAFQVANAAAFFIAKPGCGWTSSAMRSTQPLSM